MLTRNKKLKVQGQHVIANIQLQGQGHYINNFKVAVVKEVKAKILRRIATI